MDEQQAAESSLTKQVIGSNLVQADIFNLAILQLRHSVIHPIRRISTCEPRRKRDRSGAAASSRPRHEWLVAPAVEPTNSRRSPGALTAPGTSKLDRLRKSEPSRGVHRRKKRKTFQLSILMEFLGDDHLKGQKQARQQALHPTAPLQFTLELTSSGAKQTIQVLQR